MYADLEKALYGTLRAARLFYETFVKKIKSMGFKLNPYDSCVANKMVDGKQCTIIWHVDDLMVSHVSKKIVEETLDELNKEFGELAPMTITRGNDHEYLGVNIKYLKRKVQMSMKKYIKEMLQELPKDMDGTAATPAAKHLFEVNEECKKLPEKQAMMFHHYVAKLLFLCKRARPDIQTAVAFLSTRVKGPDEDDWKKLGRVMKYLRGTIEIVLTLSANGPVLVMKWWVDGAFAVHPDMRSHTGISMSLGEGMVYCGSLKQKLNTRSSTEAEVVATYDALPMILWTRYFLKEQGYEISESILFQDNMSAELLEKNGKASSGKRTRHMNIRFFFIKDHVGKSITIKHCPTEEMIGDFYTKPLQGSQFIKFRNLIMNSE